MKNNQKPGKRSNVTIKDIADAVGVSYSTVSRALNDHPHTAEEIKERVRDAARRMGYFPNTAARMMRGSPGTQIGLIVPDIENPLFTTCARVAADHCSRLGYQLVLSVSEDLPDLEKRHVQAMREAHVAGLIIAACANTDEETERLLASVPAVQLALRNDRLTMPSVATADFAGFYGAARHLLQLGHRRIAFVGGPEGLHTAEQRLAGVSRALAEQNVPLDEALTVRVPLRSDASRTATSALLRLPHPPTAIIAGNSVIAVGILEAVSRAGIKVPDELSLIGCGDQELFRLWGPGVTTLNAPLTSLCEAAFSILHQQIIEGKPKSGASACLTLDYDLILRGTTGPVRRS